LFKVASRSGQFVFADRSVSVEMFGKAGV